LVLRFLEERIASLVLQAILYFENRFDLLDALVSTVNASVFVEILAHEFGVSVECLPVA